MIGNSMGGFVGAELTVRFPTRVSKLVLVSAAGLSTEYLSREPLLAGARIFMALTARTGLRGSPVVKRPRLRRIALAPIVRYPERLSVPLATELVQGANAPGFMDAFEALMSYSFRDKLARIEVPTLIVWGRNDMLVPVADAEMFEHLIGDNAHSVIFEDTGHLLDARAAEPLQRAAARVPGRRARAGAGRRGRQRVTAPSEALETSFAYLASTPLPLTGSGDS